MRPPELIGRKPVRSNASYGGGRARRLTRNLARALALTWSLWWLYFGASSGLAGDLTLAGVLFRLTVPGLVFLVTTAIAWRWHTVGGSLLVLESLFILIVYLVNYSRLLLDTTVFMLSMAALPPLVAGYMFLVSSRLGTQTAISKRMRQYKE